MIFKGLKFESTYSGTIYEISKIEGDTVFISWITYDDKNKETDYSKRDVLNYIKQKLWLPLNNKQKLSLYLL